MQENPAHQVILDLQQQRDELGNTIDRLRKIYGFPLEPDRNGGSKAPHTVRAHRRKRRAPVRSNGGKPTEKACKKCGATKPLEEFPTSKLCLDGHTNECRACCRIRAQEWYSKHHPAKTPPTSPSTAPAPSLKCRLCNANSSSKEKLLDHMQLIHNGAHV